MATILSERVQSCAGLGTSGNAERVFGWVRLLSYGLTAHPGARVMRVRITRPADGEVDGIYLKAFQTGLTYEVAPSLGCYLITTLCAEPVGSDDPALLVPLFDAHVAMSAERVRAVAAEMARVRRSSTTFTAPEPAELQ